MYVAGKYAYGRVVTAKCPRSVEKQQQTRRAEARSARVAAALTPAPGPRKCGACSPASLLKAWRRWLWARCSARWHGEGIQSAGDA